MTDMAMTVVNGTAIVAPQTADSVRQQLDELWLDVAAMERNGQLVNTTLAADWLLLGERALSKEQIPNARRCSLWALHWLRNAEKCASETKWGYLAIAVELAYLFLTLGAPILLILWAGTSREISSVQEGLSRLADFRLFEVPLFLFVWGFLGGIVWCLYSAAYWTRARLFSKQYVAWHIAHPWVSAVLGAGASFLVFAGLAGITGSALDIEQIRSSAEGTAYPSVLMATLAVISFVAGFSTRHLWNILDQSVRRLFGDSGGKRTFLEENIEELRQEITKA
jgi:hypothetical protein